MTLIQAAILGVVEGITEFLPVSSTGHLILANRLMGLTDEAAKSFDVAIQSGAILAVVVLFWGRFRGLLDFKAEGGLKGKRGLTLLALTTLPAVLLGPFLNKPVKNLLYGPLPVLAAFVVGALAILWVESRAGRKGDRALEALDARAALLIGCAQVLAMWPGMSRSAMTILGGMLLGLSREDAAEYSFLAAVPVLFAATAYELGKPMLHHQGLSLGVDPALFAVGFAVSFVVALGVVKGFMALLRRFSLKPFAWYRIAMAPVYYFIVGRG